MTDLLRDPVFILGVQRLVAILVGAFVVHLGFKLFSLRVSTCKTTVSGEGSFGKWFLSGTAPGIFFMAAGVAVIVASVMCGSAEAEETAAHEFRTSRPAGTANAGRPAPHDSQALGEGKCAAIAKPRP
jgi:hypothetical protein